jgi:hypothetical protein
MEKRLRKTRKNNEERVNGWFSLDAKKTRANVVICTDDTKSTHQ